jgi:hypothetical protein
MKANWKAVVESVFEPFTKASGRVDLLPLLTTEDLPKEVKQLQFKRFKTSKLLGVNAAHLPGGGFLCLYEHTDGRYLAFTLPTLNEADEKSVYDWGDSLGLVQEDLDASSFLFLCHELKGYFLTKSYYRKKDEALNIIDVVNDRYNGHSFDDLISFYEYVYVFKISEENPFYNEGISYFGFKFIILIQRSTIANNY